MKYPYPIKDFTKPKQYPDPDKRSSALLAWEFLRRNPKYQEDFDKFKKLKSSSAKRKLQEKWLSGISSLTLFDPKDNQPRRLKLALPHAPRFNVIKGKETVNIESLNEGGVSVTFNLNVSIKCQLEKTRKFLEQERKEQKIKPIEKNYQRHIFPLYCRILDAKAENKTNELLAKFFYGDRTKGDAFEKIKQEIKVAYRLRDLDYKFIT